MEFILESYSIGLPFDQPPGCTHHKQGKAANISQSEAETFTKSEVYVYLCLKAKKTLLWQCLC